MQILGVRRAHRFSPNSVARDAEIFNAVVLAILWSRLMRMCCVIIRSSIGFSQWREVRRL